MRSLPLGPALVAEAIGTFALVFAGCGAIALGTLGPAGVAAAFGLAIMTMIYALGHVSGAHLNPAVTAAFAVGRHFPVARVLPYWAAQVAGAIAGAALLRATLRDVPLGVTQPAGSDIQALVWEVALTFFLMLVIVAVATDTRAVGQGAAMAIGGTVALGALVGGPVSGASMNPARSLGPALVSGDLSNHGGRPACLPGGLDRQVQERSGSTWWRRRSARSPRPWSTAISALLPDAGRSPARLARHGCDGG